MLPYCIMVGIPAIMAFVFNITKYRHEKADRAVINAFFLIWLILLVFRSEQVGTDLPVYKYHFNNYPLMSWGEIIQGIFTGQFEAAYVVICKLLSGVTENFHWVIAVCAAIAVLPIWRLYRNEGQHGYLMMVLFLNVAPFAMYFSGLRQAMAMAFVVPCYYSCREKKPLHFLLAVAGAFLFHRSAVIMLLMYPVYHLRLKRMVHLLYILLIEAVVYIYSVPIFSFLIRLTGGYGEEYGFGVRSTGAYAVILLMTVFLVYAFVIPDPQKLDADSIGLRNLLVLSVMLQSFSAASTIAMRMNYYYLLLVPLAICRVIRCGNRQMAMLIRLSIICMVAFFTVYYFYYACTDSDILQVYPYISLFADFSAA